jgi:DNA-binding response OmpR family regulator
MKPRALVVDDDPEILRTVGDILVSLNHEYDPADSFTAARQCIERREYTYFLIDLQIPVQSGHGLSRIQNGENLIDEIISQDDERKRRIIAITAHGNDGPHQAVEVMKKGIADYIPKPFASSGKTLDKAILAMLARIEDKAPKSQHAAEHGAQPTPFAGGEMVFYPDHVELCGVTICCGARSKPRRDALNLLRVRVGERFAAYSGEELAEQLGPMKGHNRVPGLIRDIRKRIRDALGSQANIECHDEDVILSGGTGYRLSEKISVQDGLGTVLGKDQGHDRENRGIDDPNRVPNDPNLDDPNDPNPDDPNDPDDKAEARRIWLLQELRKGRELQAPDIVQEFRCSLTTAKRDLKSLKDKGQIEFVGTRRTGHYRLKKGTKPR